MEKDTRFVGLDVHHETIAAAVVDPGSSARSVGTVANDSQALRKLMRRLGRPDQLQVCYSEYSDGLLDLLTHSA